MFVRDLSRSILGKLFFWFLEAEKTFPDLNKIDNNLYAFVVTFYDDKKDEKEILQC